MLPAIFEFTLALASRVAQVTSEEGTWGADLMQERSGRGPGGPGVDLRLEGLEERTRRRKQTTRDQAGVWDTAARASTSAVGG
jgi:hypothetical protein